MLTIYANYAPQISHYAPEIYHYASKQNNFFSSQKHIFPSNSYKTHRKVTKVKNRSKVSPISHACCTAESKMPQCRRTIDATTGLVAFGHFFLSSHVETAHAQYAQGYKITELSLHNARCFEGSINYAGIIFASLLIWHKQVMQGLATQRRQVR